MAIFQGGKVDYAPPKFHSVYEVFWCRNVDSSLNPFLALGARQHVRHLHGKSSEINFTPRGFVSHSRHSGAGIIRLVGALSNRQLHLYSAT